MGTDDALALFPYSRQNCDCCHLAGVSQCLWTSELGRRRRELRFGNQSLYILGFPLCLEARDFISASRPVKRGNACWLSSRGRERSVQKLLHLPNVSCFKNPSSWPASQPFAVENRVVTVIMYRRIFIWSGLSCSVIFSTGVHNETKCLLSVQNSEIFFLLFYTAHLVLFYFIFFQRRISFLCTKNLTCAVKLSFCDKQSIACNHTQSGGKLLPEACADMQLSSSAGGRSRLGERARKPG